MSKRAFISGNQGLVGRHMQRVLEERDWEVYGCDLKAPSYTNVHSVFRNHNTTTKFDLVVHAAYWVGGRAAIDGQPDNLIKNMHLDAAMFEWALITGQSHVLYFSSSAAYPIAAQTEENMGSRLTEDEIDLTWPELPDGRYGLAKLIGEQQAQAARESGLKVTVVRPFSGYATDQDETYPFRALLERVKNREDPFMVWGSAGQVRDWIHMDDVVKGALAVVESETTDPVNLCTGRGTTIGDLALLMMGAITGEDWNIIEDHTKSMGVMNRVGDPSRFFEYYEPKISLEQGIVDAVKES